MIWAYIDVDAALSYPCDVLSGIVFFLFIFSTQSSSASTASQSDFASTASAVTPSLSRQSSSSKSTAPKTQQRITSLLEDIDRDDDHEDERVIDGVGHRRHRRQESEHDAKLERDLQIGLDSDTPVCFHPASSTVFFLFVDNAWWIFFYFTGWCFKYSLRGGWFDLIVKAESWRRMGDVC